MYVYKIHKRCSAIFFQILKHLVPNFAFFSNFKLLFLALIKDFVHTGSKFSQFLIKNINKIKWRNEAQEGKYLPHLNIDIHCIRAKQPSFSPQMAIVSEETAPYLTQAHSHCLRTFRFHILGII